MLPNKKTLPFKTEVYLLLSMFSENCLWSDLKDFFTETVGSDRKKT